MKILLTGGGTFGSVTPLLAIKEELEANGDNHEFLWVGTKNGPEKAFVGGQGIDYKGIYSGKLRRYFSLINITDIALIKLGFFESLSIIKKFKPDVIISAGSFVSFPVVLAGWIFKRPILIHQLDIRPGLANKLMAPFAKKITVGFKNSLNDYSDKKTTWTGNPIRSSLKVSMSSDKIKEKFGLEKDLPILLVLGGGTGALQINKLIEDSLNELIKFCQIIHVTGRGKLNKDLKSEKYHVYDFLDNLPEAYKIADGVISRAGLGTLSELAVLGKPSLIIPMPGSHQEENADIYLEAGAILLADQRKLNKESFVVKVKKIMYNKKLRVELGENMKKISKTGSNQEIVYIIKNIVK
jgi:UDP-N-acetylglucosamine--N-acetylmuramyl-(pentapeptide) pyrophosphoryl-undecaprenol N-acetylglucosamine transferase